MIQTAPPSRPHSRRPLLIGLAIFGLGGLVLLIAVGAIAWYLFSPLFIRSTVTESNPFAATPAAGAPAATAPVQAGGGSGATTRPTAAGGASTQPGSTAGTGGANSPQIAKQGQVEGTDSLHRGRGQAIIGRAANGQWVLRLENFSVTNGPDLYVYLSANPQPENHNQVTEGGLNLGKLKAPEGALNYTLPADFDPGKYQSVVIYCLQFQVVFATATLS